MRDAFGGTFMIELLLVFIFVYVAFAAVSINYATAFKVKNGVIDIIEQLDIRNLNEIKSTKSEETLIKGIKSETYENKIEKLVNKYNYNFECPSSVDNSLNDNYCYKGIVITEKETENSIIYSVSTYAGWNLGGLSIITKLGNSSSNDTDSTLVGSWKVTGEAKVNKLKKD